MTMPNYSIITVATCTPDFVNEATGLTGALCEELMSDANAVATGVGILATGEHAGSLMLVQSYAALSGLSDALAVYEGSSNYAALINSGKIGIVLRNVVQQTQLGFNNTAGKTPKYAVVTRMQTPGLMQDEAGELTHHFEENGAMFLRYGTVITGSDVNSRVLLVGYPSMDAIENTYGALQADPKYQAFVQKASVDFRNIIRVTSTTTS